MQRLEAQVRNLKTLLARVAGPIPLDEDCHPTDWPQNGNGVPDPLPKDIESLMRNDLGRVSLHGPTSFVRASISPPQPSNEAKASKLENEGRTEWQQRLVTNALQQRVLEGLLETPVSLESPACSR